MSLINLNFLATNFDSTANQNIVNFNTPVFDCNLCKPHFLGNEEDSDSESENKLPVLPKPGGNQLHRMLTSVKKTEHLKPSLKVRSADSLTQRPHRVSSACLCVLVKLLIYVMLIVLLYP